MGANFFTNGEYGKAVDDWRNTVSSTTGNAGYSNAQAESIKNANDIARGKAAEYQGDLRARGATKGQVASLAAQQAGNAFQENSSYDRAKQLQKSARNWKEKMAAEQFEQAKTNRSIASNLFGSATQLANNDMFKQFLNEKLDERKAHKFGFKNAGEMHNAMQKYGFEEME